MKKCIITFVFSMALTFTMLNTAWLIYYNTNLKDLKKTSLYELSLMDAKLKQIELHQQKGEKYPNDIHLTVYISAMEPFFMYMDLLHTYTYLCQSLELKKFKFEEVKKVLSENKKKAIINKYYNDSFLKESYQRTEEKIKRIEVNLFDKSRMK